MSRRGWTDDESEEYEEFLEAAFLAADTTEGRIDAAESLLWDAVQAQRQWARGLEHECIRRGLNHELTRWGARRQPRVMVDLDGRVVAKSRRRGTKVRGDDGATAHQQVLYEEMSWRDWEESLRIARRQARATADNAAVLRRIGRLRELHPDSFGVAEALALQGCSLDEWLAAS